jgi:hypothetical protein
MKNALEEILARFYYEAAMPLKMYNTSKSNKM